MNDHRRIPEKRPILFELFCPKCGGSLYALDEEEIYIGRNQRITSPAGFTITKLECVLCLEKFDVEGIGLRYEKSIADELGWPFPVKIPEGPSVIPEHVEKRMRKREQEPDPKGDSIDDFYADQFNRIPSSLEKDVLRFILQRKGRLERDSIRIQEIRIPDKEGASNALITGINLESGLTRDPLSNVLTVNDFSEGDIIESTTMTKNKLQIRSYYSVINAAFQLIARTKR